MASQPLSIALYQPDIPQNAGAIMRLAACFGLPVHIIEPCGFVLDNRKLRRAGMDYRGHAQVHRHLDWSRFSVAQAPVGRRVLATRHGATTLATFRFRLGDSIILGRESAGAPAYVHNECEARVFIPMHADLRSLNVAQSAGILAYEACRQLGLLAAPHPSSAKTTETMP